VLRPACAPGLSRRAPAKSCVDQQQQRSKQLQIPGRAFRPVDGVAQSALHEVGHTRIFQPARHDYERRREPFVMPHRAARAPSVAAPARPQEANIADNWLGGRPRQRSPVHSDLRVLARRGTAISSLKSSATTQISATLACPTPESHRRSGRQQTRARCPLPLRVRATERSSRTDFPAEQIEVCRVDVVGLRRSAHRCPNPIHRSSRRADDNAGNNHRRWAITRLRRTTKSDSSQPTRRKRHWQQQQDRGERPARTARGPCNEQATDTRPRGKVPMRCVLRET